MICPSPSGWHGTCALSLPQGGALGNAYICEHAPCKGKLLTEIGYATKHLNLFPIAPSRGASYPPHLIPQGVALGYLKNKPYRLLIRQSQNNQATMKT